MERSRVAETLGATEPPGAVVVRPRRRRSSWDRQILIVKHSLVVELSGRAADGSWVRTAGLLTPRRLFRSLSGSVGGLLGGSSWSVT